MVADVDICNQALSSIGTQSTIATLTEQSTEAQHCSIHYALPLTTVPAGSPIILVQNNLSKYALIDSTYNGITWPATGGVVTLAVAPITLAPTNISASYSAGPSAGPPYITPPTADFVDEATYDYHLASGSSAIGVGTDPGVSLRPLWQISYSGTPTVGTPIPPLTARPNYNDAGAFAYGTGS